MKKDKKKINKKHGFKTCQSAGIDGLLLAQGVKPSLHRVRILEYLRNNYYHPTADSIYKKLNKDIPTLSKTTVYNTLSLFVEKKIISVVSISDTELRYDCSPQSHIHFQCLKCKKIEDIFLAEGNDLFSKKEIQGRRITDCCINYKGFCRSCREKMSGENRA